MKTVKCKSFSVRYYHLFVILSKTSYFGKSFLGGIFYEQNLF